jgi:alpha-beta hydrolase superfamily lysophospholipase
MTEHPVEFKVRNQKVSGIISVPDEKNPPVVILVHGFGVDMSEVGTYPILAEKLCEQGFMVLRFDFRGHGKSFGSLDKMTIGTEIEDFQTALDKVCNLEVNKNKIGVVASSFGAVPVILSGDRRIKSLVLWNPIVRPKEDLAKLFDIHCDKGWQQYIMQNKFLPYRGKRVNWDFWDGVRLMDMTKETQDIHAPTLILYAAEDQYISEKNTRDLFYAITGQRDKKVFQDMHGLRAEGIREQAINECVNWFTKWLKI